MDSTFTIKDRTTQLYAILGLAIFLVCPAAAQTPRDREDDSAAERAQRTLGLTRQPRQPQLTRLGVFARNTPTGAVIVRVQPNSPAEQVGLEVGDTIITVGGYQIGIVDGQTYDLADEWGRRMDRQERATLLVLNHRTGRLTNIPLSLDSRSTTIQGTIQTSARNLVFPGMIANVRLVDVTQPQWEYVTIAETELPFTGRWPMNFVLEYDPQSLRPRHRYALQATLSHRGEVLLVTPSPVPFDARQDTVRPTLQLIPAAIATPAPPNLDSPIDQVRWWYEEWLGRELSSRERAVWQRELAKGKPLDDIMATVLGSEEFFDRFRGDNAAFVGEVYVILNGQPPTPRDVQRWTNRLAQLRDLRYNLVVEMMRAQGR